MNMELVAQMISAIKVKNDLLNTQVVQLTLLLEHLYEKLSKAEESGLTLNLDLDNYETWVQKRMDALSEEIEKQNLDEIENKIDTEIKDIINRINLSEKE